MSSFALDPPPPPLRMEGPFQKIAPIFLWLFLRNQIYGPVAIFTPPNEDMVLFYLKKDGPLQNGVISM